MTFLVPISLFGWPLVVVALFAFLRPTLATSYAYALSWCFLPNASYAMPGLPDYTKSFTASIGVLLGLVIFSPQAVARFKPTLIDLLPLVFCCSPFITSVLNGLGAYDGASSVVSQLITWGIPYLVGRCVYSKIDQVADLVNPIIVCGLIYIPLCLWEVRMSPQLHYKIYGFQQHQFAQTRRWGGWRPMVFMQHGLQVGLWMCGCVLLLFSQWWSGRQTRFLGLPMVWTQAAMSITFILLKSTGAYFLALLGAAVLILARYYRAAWPVALIPMLVVFYLGGRASEIYTGRGLENLSREYIGDARADSLKTRLDNEDRLIAKAKQQWLFGWGGWGRNRVYNEDGKDITITDGLWIITFGQNGIVGLMALYGMLLAGTCAIACWPATKWRVLSPSRSANLAGLMVVSSLAALDSIPNAVLLPIFIVAIGAIASIATTHRNPQSLSSSQFVEFHPPANQ